MTRIEIFLLATTCLLIMIIALILNAEYEFCFVVDNENICSYQKIGDYLFGLDNVEEIVKND